MAREEHELITDIRDFRTLFHAILSRETSVRFMKTIDFVDVVRLVITCFAYVSRVRCDSRVTGRHSPVILNMAAQTAKICTIESVVFYVDPKSLGPLNFLGKEGIRFPVTNEHSSLTVFKRKFAEFAGLKAEAEKRGLGSCIELKFCRLEKGKVRPLQ